MVALLARRWVALALALDRAVARRTRSATYEAVKPVDYKIFMNIESQKTKRSINQKHKINNQVVSDGDNFYDYISVGSSSVFYLISYVISWPSRKSIDQAA